MGSGKSELMHNGVLETNGLPGVDCRPSGSWPEMGLRGKVSRNGPSLLRNPWDTCIGNGSVGKKWPTLLFSILVLK